MGLDMFLVAKKHLSEYNEQQNKISKEIEKLKVGNLNFRINELTCEVGYWRKANAIHKWFVDHVQDGEDDCKSYYVARSDMAELLKACDLVINDPTQAQNLLPPQDGFFFGSTNTDEFYMQDLQDTKKILEEALKLDDSWHLYYQASW